MGDYLRRLACVLLLLTAATVSAQIPGPNTNTIGTHLYVTMTCPATVIPNLNFTCAFTATNMDPGENATALVFDVQTAPVVGGASAACDGGVTAFTPHGTAGDHCSGLIHLTASGCPEHETGLSVIMTDRAYYWDLQGWVVGTLYTSTTVLMCPTPTATATPLPTATFLPGTPSPTPTNTRTHTPTPTITPTPGPPTATRTPWPTSPPTQTPMPAAFSSEAGVGCWPPFR